MRAARARESHARCCRSHLGGEEAGESHAAAFDVNVSAAGQQVLLSLLDFSRPSPPSKYVVP